MGKLVRDKVPEIAKDKEFRKCKEDEMIILLAKKLCEEAIEFLTSLSVEELADVAEVLDTLINIYGKEKVMAIKEEKRKKRGGFSECWVLED